MGRSDGNPKHNKHGTPVYRSWQAMLTRCRNSKQPYYQHYGGRGISVCPEWHEFINFYNDMGDRPENTTLDRIDNDGNYEPSNCRWGSLVDQQFNKSNSLRAFNKPLSVLAQELGIKYDTLYKKYKRSKLSLEEVLRSHYGF